MIVVDTENVVTLPTYIYIYIDDDLYNLYHPLVIIPIAILFFFTSSLFFRSCRFIDIIYTIALVVRIYYTRVYQLRIYAFIHTVYTSRIYSRLVFIIIIHHNLSAVRV